MQFITNIINKFIIKAKPNPLGRWNIDYCNKKINQKIDLSNEDHCGPCGQYIINKISTDKNTSIKDTPISTTTSHKSPF